ncbi:hypothetical protein ACHAQA_008979 [Verticillium albo-atrum]
MPNIRKPITLDGRTAIQYLAKATAATTTSLDVGTTSLTFAPSLQPHDLAQRHIIINPESPSASALLILQALLPYLIFAAGDPITLDIAAGTNVSFSLSWDYADQVLLPTLEARFGVQVNRTLIRRGWSQGPSSRGAVRFKITPLARGQALRPRVFDDAGDRAITTVDVTIIAPGHMHQDLQNRLTEDIGNRFPAADVEFRTVEDSGHDARVYVLLVARSAGGLRWGRDVLTSTPKKGKAKGRSKTKDEDFPTSLSRKLTEQLSGEVSRPGVCDEHLQDQLIIFQALAEGQTSFPRDDAPVADEHLMQQAGQGAEERQRKDKTHEPFGQGSLHTQTARWVASELLPTVKWYNKGKLCEGVGMIVKSSSLDESA